MKKIVILSASLRPVSNSRLLAEAFRDGALSAGHSVELISLRGKKIGYCTGCMACAQRGSCVIRDDAVELEEKVVSADVVVWATPVYYHQMSGIMKTLMDRLNPMYPKERSFRDVYVLATAADTTEEQFEHVAGGVQAWVDNFPEVRYAGGLFCGGVDAPGELRDDPRLKDAYEMGKNI